MIDFSDITPETILDFITDEAYRKYFISGAIILFIVIYVLIAVLPAFTKYSDVSAKVSDLDNKISIMNKSVMILGKRREQLKSLREELTKYSEGFPEHKEISQFLEKLTEIAVKSGVRILSIVPMDLKPVKPDKDGKSYYYQMPISITAKGGYHQMAKFVSNLERDKRYMTIDGLKLSYNPSSPRKHNIKLLIKTYVSVEDEKK